MSKNRLEAFSDGIFAILITIMVLELKTPTDGSWQQLLKPAFFSTLSAYILSFFFIASFWISHHTIINPVQTVDKKLLWTNILLLLPISLLPLVTAWHGEFPTAVAPSVCYILIYVLSVLGLYVLGQVSLNRVTSNSRHKCYLINKTRLHLVVFGFLSTALTFLIPLISSIAVFAILIYWLISSTIHDK
ncbi:TMEM175 family protein [Ligilactobacillus sp. WILCCON 0076]|uniref:TMEM175 family protein n=1 Tax=Ligilactobacillus ubinensis TaxID=2876789 RepID=A0A9X2JJV7_9LACO|nr:TMEM175 family protein [Ligilactobacillus ubinensis]MCP0885808.1 TMEM175 family protein [Ligilactobacillus ubinensis]